MSVENRKVQALSKGWGFLDIMHMDRRVARIYENGRCTIRSENVPETSSR